MVAATKKDVEAIFEKLNELTQAVTTQIASCKPCRDIVLGNGKKPINERMASVEVSTQNIEDLEKNVATLQATVDTSKWFIARTIAAMGLVFTVIQIGLKCIGI